ncbi:hypothetical protein QF002_004997 [Paraburkholderia youngii]
MDDDIKRQVSVDIGRRNLLKLTGVNAAAAGVLSLSNRISFAQALWRGIRRFPKATASIRPRCDSITDSAST